MLYIYESSVTFQFLGFFRSTVSKLFFHCVTVKQRITNPLCSSQFGDYASIPHIIAGSVTSHTVLTSVLKYFFISAKTLKSLFNLDSM